MNEITFLILGGIIGLLSSTLGTLVIHRRLGNTHKQFIGRINQEESALLTDIAQIGERELLKTHSGVKLLSLLYDNAYLELRSLAQIAFREQEDYRGFVDTYNPEHLKKLANALRISVDKISIVDQNETANIIQIVIPSRALDRFVRLHETKDPLLIKELGIVYIGEVFDERFNFRNIRHLFMYGFTKNDLEAFGRKYLKDSDKLFADRTKPEMVYSVLAYASEKDMFPELLHFAREYRVKSYKEFGPYYKSPKKSPRPATLQLMEERLTHREYVNVLIRGVGIAALGSMLISLITLFFEYLRIDRSLWPVLNLMLGIVSAQLGNFVGDQVLIGANHKRDPTLDKLAVFCYLYGFFLGYLIPIIFDYIYLFNFRLEMPEYGLKWVIFLLTLPIIAIFLYITISFFDLFGGFWGMFSLFTRIAGLVLGSYYASKRVG